MTFSEIPMYNQKPKRLNIGRLLFGNVAPFILGFSVSLCVSTIVYIQISCSFHEDIDTRSSNVRPHREPATVPVLTPASQSSASPQAEVYNASKSSANSETQFNFNDDLKFWMPNSTWQYDESFFDIPGVHHFHEVLKRIGTPVYHAADDWDVTIATFTNILNNAKHLPKKFKKHQKVNFMPGMTMVTSKDLLLSRNLPNMAKSFSIPGDIDKFHEYVKTHPNSTWLHKMRNHRGLGVRMATEDDIKNPKPFTMLQEFISNPFVIDNRKLEVGIYAVVTSVNPLRVYINEGDWYLRFCVEEYYPFDINNRDKYVSQSESHMWTWQIPSLKDGHDLHKLTNKANLLAYFKSKGLNPQKMEETMKEIIRNVYTTTESDVIITQKKRWPLYNALHRNFFEIHRFDFVLDEALIVYLIEVNLNPGFSSDLAPIRRQQNQRTIYGVYSLAGLISNPRKPFIRSDIAEKEMRVFNKDISSFALWHWSGECKGDCSAWECRFSIPCLTEEKTFILESAVIEHFHRLDWVRIVPEPFQSQEAARKWDRMKDPHFVSLTPTSRWMAEWYWSKCLDNIVWCT